jgi:hypothetical protein
MFRALIKSATCRSASRSLSGASSSKVSPPAPSKDSIPSQKCGDPNAPEMLEDEKVNVQNPVTGEIMGPSGKEPTR